MKFENSGELGVVTEAGAVAAGRCSKKIKLRGFDVLYLRKTGLLQMFSSEAADGVPDTRC